MKNKISLSLGFLLCICLLIPLNSQALNLVTNPGFETGNLSGWTGSPWTVESSSDFGGEAVHSGSYGGVLNTTLTPPGTTSILTQDITLTEAGLYEFGGWLRFFTTDPNENFDRGEISLGFGSIYPTLGSTPANTQPFVSADSRWGGDVDFLMSDWFYFEGVFNNSSLNPVVAIFSVTLQNQFSELITSVAIDDLFVNTSVPEPGTMLLLGTGLIGLAGLRRRLKK